MWQKVLENAKLIISTFLVIVSLVTGGWTLISNVLVTKSYAEAKFQKLDLDTSYNKAFRLDNKIERLERIQENRKLTREESSQLRRYRNELGYVESHIEVIEDRRYSDDDE